MQFHAELTFAMVHRWTTRGAARLTMAGAQERRLHIEGRYMHDAAVRRWLGEFLDLWVGSPRKAKVRKRAISARG